MATIEVEAMHFIAKYNFNLSHILIKINPISLYNFCEKWLDTLHYLLPIQIEKKCPRLSLPSQTPNQQTEEWGIVFLTPTQQFTAISWREQVNCQWDDVCCVLHQGA